ncbi:MAG: CotH kinase family protein [Oscillospiraceae bacterium]|nr:CotH kinase family protein [Oscillospiraceae bacterium]
MKKFKIMLLVAAALIISGCSGTGDSMPSEIVIDPSSTADSEDSASSESSESEVFVNEEITAVIEKIAVSAENVFVSSAPELVVDDENAEITLNVDYTNYIDIRTLESLLLDIEVTGGTFELSGYVSADGGIDLTGDDAYLIVTDEDGRHKRYKFNLNRTVHDLPIVNILLEDHADVSSIQRDVYTNMEMYIDCSGSDEFSDTVMLAGAIRGRGYSTWKLDKKPYRIRLADSVPLMGMPKNRDWILLSNHADKSFMRNIVAYDMGRELDFIWTGTQYPVDLFVNGEYRGVYALGEHREISQHRINIDDSNDIDRGFVLEIGGADGDDLVNGVDYFHTYTNSARFITFADPQAYKLTEEQRQFLMDYVNEADAAIVSGEGYEEYIDVRSFCDWIIIHELTCNLDSCFRRSCYFIKDKGGKLMMGPIWDFDLAFGNFDMDNTSYNTWFTIGTTGSDSYVRVNWCNYLMNDPEFRAQLKSRWLEVRDKLLDTAYKSIDKNKAKIDASAEENFAIWDIWNKKVGYQSWATYNIQNYDGQVKYIKDFLAKRAEWIDNNI